MNYIVYDGLTGKILRTGICPLWDFNLQAQSYGEMVLEGVANDSTQNIENGEIVDSEKIKR